MNKFLVALFAFTATLSTQAQDYNKRLKGVDKELNGLLETCKAAGFAVAVVKNDQVLYAKGFGYRDYENKIPADENTLFGIGSCTKAFTASVLGLLREEGELSFEDRPADYIPGFKFYNDEMNQLITIKDMMCHRTGLPRHDWSWYFFPTDSRDSLLKRVEYQEPFTGVRRRWYYNNFMYLAQGVIAEKITGKSWEENIEERFFAPLGMERSNVSIAELLAAENASLGYTVDSDNKIKKEEYYRVAGMAPAGSINSSVTDMAKWLSVWINNGKHKGEAFLPEYYVQEATGSQMIISSSGPESKHPDLHFGTYGFGWMMSSYKGHYRVEHGGNIDGFSANVAFFPSDSVGIIVLTNQTASSVTSLARNMIADRLLGVEKSDWIEEYIEGQAKVEEATEEVAANEKVKNRVPSAHELQDFIGSYENLGYGVFDVVLRNDSLFAEFPNETFWLRHDGYDIFEPFWVHETGIDTTETGPTRMNFSTGNTGDINAVSMLMEETLEPIEFKHKAKELEVSENDLQKYTGAYDLMGTEIKVYTKGNVLYVLVPGQPEYELQATEPNKFILTIIEGYSVEFIEEGEQIKEIMFIQPNGTFKGDKK
jgi:CubicO group peptidase (beta-lactamase class C family)